MLTPRDILFGVLLPALVSAIVLVVAWRPWRRTAERLGAGWGGPLAIGGGFAAGFVGILGWPAFPPGESTHWLFALAIMLVLSGLVDILWHAPRWVRWSSVTVDAALATGLLLWPLLRMPWTLAQQAAATPVEDSSLTRSIAWMITESVTWLATLTALTVVTWWALDTFAERAAGQWLPLPILIVAGCGALTLMLSGSLKLGQLGGAPAGALAAFFAVAWWIPRPFARGATQVFVVLYAGLLMSGYFYASLTLVNAVLLAVAPIGPWASQLPAVKHWKTWQQAVIGTIAALGPAGTATTLAAVEFARSMSEYGY